MGASFPDGGIEPPYSISRRALVYVHTDYNQADLQMGPQRMSGKMLVYRVTLKALAAPEE